MHHYTKYLIIFFINCPVPGKRVVVPKILIVLSSVGLKKNATDFG